MNNNNCIICNQKINNYSHFVPEMMFGLKEKFAYGECLNCGCLQIKDLPENMEKYYPSNYYSFHNLISKLDFIISFVRQKMAAYYIFGQSNVVGKILIKFLTPPDFYHWAKKINLNLKAKILDVGCGQGHLLIGLKRAGYQHLMGIDAYINHDIFYKNGVKIYKKELTQIAEKFDFIILNHSFEHFLNPQETIKKLSDLLNNGGCLLIRVPIVPSFAWKKYGINWVQLDAPRHVFIPSIKSMEILSKIAGFDHLEVEFDSNDFQFWGSEQYQKGIPLRSPLSYGENPKKSIFTKAQINVYKNKAQELNKNKTGDSASFYFFKK